MVGIKKPAGKVQDCMYHSILNWNQNCICTEKEEGVYLHLDFHGTILASVIFMTNASFDPGLRWMAVRIYPLDSVKKLQIQFWILFWLMY